MALTISRCKVCGRQPVGSSAVVKAVPSGWPRRSTLRRGYWMTPGFRRTAGSPGVKRQYSGTLGKTGTVRSAFPCTLSGGAGRCRWGGRCISRRTGVRMSSGGARRRSQIRLCSNKPSSGWSCRARRRLGCSEGAGARRSRLWGKHVAARSSRSGRVRVRAVGRVQNEGVRARDRVRGTAQETQGNSLACPPAARSQAEPIGELIRRLGADSALKVTFRTVLTASESPPLHLRACTLRTAGAMISDGGGGARAPRCLRARSG